MRVSRITPIKPAPATLPAVAADTRSARPKARTDADPVGHGEAIEAEKPAPGTSREEQIRAAAYALFEQRGCGDGRDFDDWLQAEALVDRKLDNEAAEAKPD